MKKLKTIYSSVLILTMGLFVTLAILGNTLSENVGKDNNTVSVILPSLPLNDPNPSDTWSTSSEADIFDCRSDGGRDNMIKPGMYRKVDIVIDNRNSSPFDYIVKFNFETTNDVRIPLHFKITRYDGEVLTEDFVQMHELDGFSDSHSVGGYRYIWYTIEWIWPDTENDAEFGNYAVENELRAYVDIACMSWISSNPLCTNGEFNDYNENPFWIIYNTIVALIPLMASVLAGTLMYNFEMKKLALAGNLNAPSATSVAPSGKKCPIKVSNQLKYRYLKIRQYFDKDGRLRKDVDFNERVITKYVKRK